jgi:hypothetical protein
MKYEIEDLLNLYLNLLKCFKDQSSGFEIVRLIDEFFKIQDMDRIVIPKDTKFNTFYDLPVLLTIKKEALKLGEKPLGSFNKKKANLIKEKIELAIFTINKNFGILEFETKQEDYLKYLKSREVEPIIFTCSYCGSKVEIIRKENSPPKKLYCPYCGKAN